MMLHFRECWNEVSLGTTVLPPGACYWPKSGIMAKALFNCRSGVDACAGGSRRPRKFEGREGAVVGAQEAVKNIAIKVISRDRTRSVHAVRNGRNRARRVKLGEGRLLRTRRQAQPQRAEGEKREGEPCILSRQWDHWGSEKRMRGHWFSSSAQPSEHTKHGEEAPCWRYLL